MSGKPGSTGRRDGCSVEILIGLSVGLRDGASVTRASTGAGVSIGMVIGLPVGLRDGASTGASVSNP